MTAATLTTVPGPPGVRATATGPITHLCPFVDETDTGTITIAWTCTGHTLEIHALAAYLRSWADTRISHEDLVERIHDDVRHCLRPPGRPGAPHIVVTARFVTAGMTVEVTSGAVPGQSVHTAGA